MSSLQTGAWIMDAVLLFWIVGAYNRLVALRTALVKSFKPVDSHFAERHARLAQHIEAVETVLAPAGDRLEALRAACVQAESARVHAAAHPGAPGAIKSLRLADEILAGARARVPMAGSASSEASELGALLAASDTALVFARRQFNAAVLEYNHAVEQLPTRLVAALFGFAAAGTL
jgi:LemA protein